MAVFTFSVPEWKYPFWVNLIQKLKIDSKIWNFGTYNQCQKLWEKLQFGQFCVSTPFPLSTMLRNNEKNLFQPIWSVLSIV